MENLLKRELIDFQQALININNSNDKRFDKLEKDVEKISKILVELRENIDSLTSS